MKFQILVIRLLASILYWTVTHYKGYLPTNEQDLQRDAYSFIEKLKNKIGYIIRTEQISPSFL